MRAYVRDLLAAEFEVVAVPDGRAALDAFWTKAFDLVLADLVMPELDGLAFVDALRADPGARRVPIVMLSGRGDDDAVVAALQHGVDEFLVKPFSRRRLFATLHGHIARAHGSAKL